MILTFLPFLFSILFLLFLMIIQFKKISLRKIFKDFYFCFSVSTFLLQSSIYNSLLEVLKCKQIDDHSYIENYLSESCDSDYYYMWIKCLILPSCFFYIVFIPGLLFYFMAKNYENIYSKEVKKYLGFSLQGIGKAKFYWSINK